MPTGLIDGMDLIIKSGQISAIIPTKPPVSDEKIIDLKGDIIAAGLIDVQVNGGGGALLNDDPSVDCIRTIGAAHRRYGTTGFLPTLISDDLSKVEEAMKAVDAAIDQNIAGVMGIHIEGPFLSPAKKGIHDKDKFRTLDTDAIELLGSLQNGVTLVTLAPEQTTPQMIKTLTDRGVIVSLGHTNADYDTATAALNAGATGFTHLYNAMTGLDSRAPGVVGAALAHENSFAGVIVDGFHVHPASLKTAIRAKGMDHIMLVSDAMPCVGAENKAFTLGGINITVKDGKATGPDGTLAGSDLDMIGAVNNSVKWLDVSLGDAVKMASLTPAAFMKIDNKYGSIEVGKQASLIQINKNNEVAASWIDGSYINHL